MSFLKIKNVYKCDKKNVIFGNFDLDLSLNQIVTIVGPRKSGKTTLLNIIAGMDNNYHGDIIINNHLLDYNTRNITAYCPNTIIFNKNLKIKNILKIQSDLFLDFNYLKAVDFLAKNSIDINKKLSYYNSQIQYFIQLIIILNRDVKLYLLDNIFTNIIDINLLYQIIDLLIEKSKSSLVILTCASYEYTINYSSLFVFIEYGKLYSVVSKNDLLDNINNVGGDY